MNGENSNGILTQSHNDIEGRKIDDLTVAEAIEQGYKLLSPDQQAQLAGLVRKEKSHRAIDKEFENTNFRNTSSSKADTQRVKA